MEANSKNANVNDGKNSRGLSEAELIKLRKVLLEGPWELDTEGTAFPLQLFDEGPEIYEFFYVSKRDYDEGDGVGVKAALTVRRKCESFVEVLLMEPVRNETGCWGHKMIRVPLPKTMAAEFEAKLWEVIGRTKREAVESAQRLLLRTLVGSEGEDA